MKYCIDSDKVVWRTIGGEVILFNLDTEHYYSLNKTGSLIWACFAQEKSLEEAIQKVMDTYQISAEEAKEDVAQLLRLLQKEHLINQADES